ncbi:MAG: MBL fold metallo-hydrolase [Bacteroidia bacterium]|jgi:metallo-beta-lactamase family protein
MKVSFHGAARMVTGSKHLITLRHGCRILLDCGMFQGMGVETDELNRHFGFDPATVDYLILSHAHIDHSGLIPVLVQQGFKGKIFCTPATFDLCRIMLSDSAHIQESDARFINERRKRQGKPPIKPLYTLPDVLIALRQFEPISYREWHKIQEGIELMFTDAGHILGSAVVNLKIFEDYHTKTLCYTGDLGRLNPQIISPPEAFPQCEYLIAESTYGDRTHEEQSESLDQLLRIVIETCVLKKGKLIIPAFSVGRTQEIVYALDRLENEGRLPRISVFVDSPLSTNATEIMRENADCFNADIRKYMETDPDPFGFNKLTYIRDAEESKQLNRLKEPCIIISASGMAEAGRIKHHLANNIDNPDNTVLIVGYCEAGSLGAKLATGEKQVRIFGETHTVRAGVEVLGSFSAHGDVDEMLQVLSCLNAPKVKKVFLVHGDYEAQLRYMIRLQKAGFKHVEIPEKGSSFDL